MAEFKVGDRVKVLDKPNWPDGGYKIGNWEGTIIQIVADPAGYVTIKADKTGYKPCSSTTRNWNYFHLLLVRTNFKP